MAGDAYRWGSSTAQTVDVTSNSNRDLGLVDVVEIQDDLGISDDSQRELGQVSVTNSVDLDGTQDVDVAAASAGPFDVSAATVDVAQEAGETFTVDVIDQQGRNLGKLRLMDSEGVLIDPATEATLSTLLDRLTEVRDQAASGSGVQAGQHTVEAASTLESLPSNPVPDGKAVAVQGLPGNSNSVYVGGDDTGGYPLVAGQVVTYNVANTDEIQVWASSTNDGVAWTVEVA